MSANLQHGVPDPVGPARLDLAVPALRDLAADVYAFQELDRRQPRTGFAHQAARLAEALDGELVWAPAKRLLVGRQANALVVRGEVVEREVVVLPGSGERRVLALAVVVTSGERWTVGTAHLGLQRAAARSQLGTALDALTTRPGPWVLAGDLNLEAPDVAPIAEKRGFALLAGPDTFNARRGPTRRIDHVLAKGGTVIASGVTKLPVSDHLAVWADLAHP